MKKCEEGGWSARRREAGVLGHGSSQLFDAHNFLMLKVWLDMGDPHRGRGRKVRSRRLLPCGTWLPVSTAASGVFCAKRGLQRADRADGRVFNRNGGEFSLGKVPLVLYDLYAKLFSKWGHLDFVVA